MTGTRHYKGVPFDLVIFDCDGVLVDSEGIASRVLARELTALGHALSAEECLRRFTGMSLPSIFQSVEKDWGRPLPVDFAERLRRADDAAFAAELTEVAGAKQLLSRLSLKKCVASSGSLEKTRANLGRVGLLEFLEPHLFSAAMVDRGKPAPDLFLFAAGRMGAVPHRSIVIEDSEAGVEAGRAAGMFVAGFAGASHCSTGYGDRLRARGADVVVSRLEDVGELLAFAISTERRANGGSAET